MALEMAHELFFYKPKICNPSVETTQITTPAIIKPDNIAIDVVFKSKFKKLAPNVPVQAPVKGSGIPTNKANARNTPCFLFLLSNADLAFSPLRIKKRQIRPIYFLLDPYIRNFLANICIIGTGSILPMMHIIIVRIG